MKFSIFIKTIFISIVFFTATGFAQQNKPAVESFEKESVLSEYKTENSNLITSKKHYKYGKNSLKWSWSDKASFGTSNFKFLTLEESPLAYGNYFPASPTLQMAIYNEVSQDEQITISYQKDGKKEVWFNLSLNFTGWRKIWVPFYEMDGNAPKKGTAVNYDYFKITTTAKSGTLFFDDIIFSQYQDDRHQFPDNLIPFIKEDKKLREDFWMPLAVNFNRIKKLEKKTISVATRLDLNKFESLIAKDLEVPKKYKTYINSLKSDFNTLGIYEKEGVVLGPPLTFYDQQEYFNKDQQGVKRFNDVKAFGAIMRKLSHFYDRSTPEETKQIEEMFVLGTKYFLDQGWQAGTSGGTRHHVGYFVRGIAEGFFTMRKTLYKEGLLNDVANSMHWLFNLGMLLDDKSTFKVNIDYLNTQSYYHLMLIFLVDNQEGQAALLKAYSNYMSIILAQQNEEWGFKIDGTSWHHNGHYPAYGLGAFQNVPKVIKTLSRTRFRVKTAGHQNFKKAFLTSSEYSQLYNWGFGNAGRHPLENNGIESLKDQYLMMAQSGNPEGNSKIDRDVAAAYLRLWGKEDVFNSTVFRDIEGIASQKLKPYKTLPYAATAIQRKGNDWAAIIKGYSKYVWASEIYVDENRYGRYPANGTIELLNNKGESGSGFRQEGWDWNRYPGATIIYLPLKELETKKPLLMFRSDETFAGTTTLNGNGIFGMILNEGSGSNADGDDTKNGFPGKLKAKKSVFSFGDKLISIGTNISSVDTKNATQTNLFQSFLPDSKQVLYSSNGKMKKLGSKEILTKKSSSKKWIIDPYGSGYYLLSKNDTYIQKKTQDSYHNKYSIHTGKMNAKGKGVKETQGDYATGWLDHGFAPKDASYQYVIYPFLDKDKQADFNKYASKDNSYTILRADNIAHIVKDKKSKITGYVVFEADKSLENGLLEKVSNPCLIMIGNEETNVAELSVVQPDLNFEAYKKGRYINFSRPVPLSFTLKGKWNTSKTNFIKSISYKDGNTTFSLECKDGLPRIFSISKI